MTKKKPGEIDFEAALTELEQIVEQHGGELAIDTNSPKGCSFAIRLPLNGKADG